MLRSRTLVALAAAVLAGLVLVSERSRTVYRASSGSEEVRVVERSDGVRVLYLGSARGRQTALHPDLPSELVLPYTRVAMTALALVEGDARILFVGLGGGAMPRYVRWLLPEARVEVVEIDPRVVTVARDWFGLRTDSLLTVHVADGRAWIEGAEPRRWDLVVLDAFSGGEVPRALATREFLQAVRASLSDSGVVVGNLHTTAREYESMLATYQAVFPSVALLDVPRRRQKIVLAAGPGLVTRSRLLGRIEALTADRDPGFDARELVERRYEPAGAPRAPVLTDGG